MYFDFQVNIPEKLYNVPQRTTIGKMAPEDRNEE